MKKSLLLRRNGFIPERFSEHFGRGFLLFLAVFFAFAVATKADTHTVTFTQQGCSQWVVPVNYTGTLQIEATGAAGGNGTATGLNATAGTGGVGDKVAATLSGVTAGQTLQVCVDVGGGPGSSNDSSSGAGGGASGVAFDSNFSQPIVVAAGGGGGGAVTSIIADLTAGNGGAAGTTTGSAGLNGNGDNGNATGGNGGTGGTTGYGPPIGGSPGLGGAAGDNGVPGNPGTNGAQFSTSVASGGSGAGGAGNVYGQGGGGGAGWYGGGGGGSAGFGAGGGGGGGSDFCSQLAGVGNCTVTSGAGTGTGAGTGPGDAHVTLVYGTGETPSLVVTTTSDGSTNMDGLTSLREAIAYAATLSGPQTITFNIPTNDAGYNASSGGFVISLSTVGDNTFGASALLVSSNVTIDGGATPITITRDATAQPDRLRLFYVAPTGNLTLKNLTLSGGRAAGGNGNFFGGGGGAAGMGGAIVNAGSLQLVQTTLTGNQAVGGSNSNGAGFGGGGMGENSPNGQGGGGPNGGYIGGGAGFGGGGEGNQGGNGGFGGGGGLGEPGIAGGAGGFGGGGGQGVTSSAGSAGFGGGRGGAGFSNGRAGGGAGLGGAILNYGGILTVTNSTLVGNAAVAGQAGGNGGSENGSGFGGAIFNLNGTVAATNATIANNVSSNGGGAIYSLGDNGVATQSGPTLRATTPASPAAITLTNTILGGSNDGAGTPALVGDFVQNTNDSGNGGGAGYVASSGDFNLIQTHAAAANDFAGTATTADPKLAPLDTYGGTTETQPLLSTSLAIDAGTATGAPATDQRGADRVGNVDIGAFESNNSTNGGSYVVVLPSQLAGLPYSYTIASNAGSFSYSTPAGNLPRGLSLTTVNGVATLSGTPTQGGTFTFAITIADGTNSTVVNYSLTILSVVVTTAADTVDPNDGQTSLREALASVAQSGGGPITFSNTTAGTAANFFDGQPHTITLGGSELTIDSNVQIIGPGADVLIVSGNHASRVFEESSGVTATLSGMTITDGNSNSAGGIFSNGTLTLDGVNISGNFATNLGGAIANQGALTITNSTIAGNTSGAAGGIFTGTGVTVTMSNSTISGNTATSGLGGGIYNNANTTLTHVTIAGNSAGGALGGGVFGNTGSLTASNCIFAGNTAPASPDFAGTLNSQGYNLIGNSSGTAISGNTTGNILDQPARLAPLAWNGGSTPTQAPLSNSPAIDAGTDPGGSGLDQRGAPRPIVYDPSITPPNGGDRSDIGAVELAVGVQPISAVSRKVHGSAGAFDIPLALNGPVGIECRSGGANGDYQVVLNFAAPITYDTVGVSSGVGSVSSMDSRMRRKTRTSGITQLTISLTGVANAQQLTLAVLGASDGTHYGDVGLSFGILLGDVTGDGTVNASDIGATKFRSGQLIDATNLRADVVPNGVINATDISAVKAASGMSLP